MTILCCFTFLAFALKKTARETCDLPPPVWGPLLKAMKLGDVQPLKNSIPCLAKGEFHKVRLRWKWGKISSQTTIWRTWAYPTWAEHLSDKPGQKILRPHGRSRSKDVQILRLTAKGKTDKDLFDCHPKSG